MGKVGFGGVANYANVYPDAALGVVADANNGWGNAVGGRSVIVDSNGGPTKYYILMEGTGYVLQENGDKILLEVS